MKIVRGNPGKRPINEKEPKPEVAIPSCPPHLGSTARKEWDRLSRELFALGVLTGLDRAALAAYCDSYADWVYARNKIKKHGRLIETKEGNIIQSPYVGMSNTAKKLMHKFLIEFGLTPSSRSRISVDKNGAEKDPAEAYFG